MRTAVQSRAIWRSCGRVVLAFIVYLTLGSVTNVATTWLMIMVGVFPRYDQAWQSTPQTHAPPVTPPWPIRLPEGSPLPRAYTTAQMRGTKVERFILEGDRRKFTPPRTEDSDPELIWVISSGWPTQSLFWNQYARFPEPSVFTYRWHPPLPYFLSPPGRVGLPIMPRWPHFAINAALHGAICLRCSDRRVLDSFIASGNGGEFVEDCAQRVDTR